MIPQTGSQPPSVPRASNKWREWLIRRRRKTRGRPHERHDMARYSLGSRGMSGRYSESKPSPATGAVSRIVSLSTALLYGEVRVAQCRPT